MKIPSLCLLFAMVALPALADDTSNLSAPAPTTPSTTAPATGTTSPVPQGQRMERLREAMAQLDLTDAQKAQIRQIRASVTDKKERRQQIMSVLTPDQKAKLLAMWQAHKNGGQAGGNAASGDADSQ